MLPLPLTLCVCVGLLGGGADELEKALVEGAIEVSDLPALWSEVSGVHVRVRDGALQN